MIPKHQYGGAGAGGLNLQKYDADLFHPKLTDIEQPYEFSLVQILHAITPFYSSDHTRQ
jgi:hypothetical protein